MKELVTAKRKGHDTCLKWICLDGGKIKSVIKEGGKEINVHEIGELINFYNPIAPESMFKDYFKRSLYNEIKEGFDSMEESRSKKKQPQQKPKEDRPKIPNKKTQKAIEDINKGKAERVDSIDDIFPDVQEKGSPEKFSDTIETTLVLEIYKPDGELFYTMEFEAEEDFAYKLRKMKEAYSTYKFVRKTMRSMVSYVNL